MDNHVLRFTFSALCSLALMACSDSGGSVQDAASDDVTAMDVGIVDAGPGYDAITDGAWHLDFPQATTQGGQMTGPIKLVSIVASGDPMASDVFTFGDALATSNWWTTVSAVYKLGSIAHTKLTGAAISSSTMTQHQIVQYVAATLAANNVVPDAHTVNVFYLPPNVVATDDNGTNANTSCSLYSGYHWYDAYTPNKSLIFAMVARCPVYAPFKTVLDVTTSTASHEVIEAATNPLADKSGWTLETSALAPLFTPWEYVPGYPGEVADLCAWTYDAEGGHVYQRVWSNAAAAAGGDPCVPAGPDPYDCVSSQRYWYPMTDGGVQIPIVGWSTTSPRPGWNVEPWVGYGSSTAMQNASVTPTKLTIHRGEGATITVSAPAAKKGDYAVLEIDSYTTWETHPWAVGVYVP